MCRAAAAAGLLLLLHAGSRHDGRGWVEGSVTNSAADFLGSLTAPEPSEFRLRPDLVHELPYDIDHTLLLAPPDLPEDLQHPYVTRVDFRLAESSAKRWIDDENLLGARVKKSVSIRSQRVMESLILDFLCLDQAKGLIKVPLCALQQLEVSPHDLNLIVLRRPLSQKNTVYYRPSLGAEKRSAGKGNRVRR